MTRGVWISLLALAAASAYGAENWRGVGEDIYVDLSTAERKGDIGRIYVRMGDAKGFMEFDCVRMVYLEDRETKFEEGSPLHKVATAACKRWFEVWK